MKIKTFAVCGLALGMLASVSTQAQSVKAPAPPVSEEAKPAVRPKPERFAAAIAKFSEEKLSEAQAKGGIVFTGSSSIRMWKLDDYFTDLPVLNRGFGGSVATDSIHYIRETVLDYAPKVVVLYTGSNDIHNRLTVDEAFADYQKLVSLIREGLPKSKIIINAVKSGNRRIAQKEKVEQLNQRLEAYAKTLEGVTYIDTASYLLGPDGKPDDSYYLADQLHLNKKGYDKWYELFEPVLRKVWESAQD